MPKTDPSKPSSSKARRAASPSSRTTRSKAGSAKSPNATPVPLSKAVPFSASLPPKPSAASPFGPPRGIKPNEPTSKSLKKKTNTSSSAVSTLMSPPKPSTSKVAPPASSSLGKSKPTSRTSILPPALAAPRAGAQFAKPAYPDSDQPMSLDLDVSTVSKKELDPFEMTDQERRSVHFLDHPFVADLIPLVRRRARLMAHSPGAIERLLIRAMPIFKTFWENSKATPSSPLLDSLITGFCSLSRMVSLEVSDAVCHWLQADKHLAEAAVPVNFSFNEYGCFPSDLQIETYPYSPDEREALLPLLHPDFIGMFPLLRQPAIIRLQNGHKFYACIKTAALYIINWYREQEGPLHPLQQSAIKTFSFCLVRGFQSSEVSAWLEILPDFEVPWFPSNACSLSRTVYPPRPFQELGPPRVRHLFPGEPAVEDPDEFPFVDDEPPITVLAPERPPTPVLGKGKGRQVVLSPSPSPQVDELASDVHNLAAPPLQVNPFSSKRGSKEANAPVSTRESPVRTFVELDKQTPGSGDEDRFDALPSLTLRSSVEFEEEPNYGSPAPNRGASFPPDDPTDLLSNSGYPARSPSPDPISMDVDPPNRDSPPANRPASAGSNSGESEITPKPIPRDKVVVRRKLPVASPARSSSSKQLPASSVPSGRVLRSRAVTPKVDARTKSKAASRKKSTTPSAKSVVLEKPSKKRKGRMVDDSDPNFPAPSRSGRGERQGKDVAVTSQEPPPVTYSLLYDTTERTSTIVRKKCDSCHVASCTNMLPAHEIDLRVQGASEFSHFSRSNLMNAMQSVRRDSEALLQIQPVVTRLEDNLRQSSTNFLRLIRSMMQFYGRPNVGNLIDIPEPLRDLFNNYLIFASGEGLKRFEGVEQEAADELNRFGFPNLKWDEEEIEFFRQDISQYTEFQPEPLDRPYVGPYCAEWGEDNGALALADLDERDRASPLSPDAPIASGSKPRRK
ncbi:hypothetical protein B0H16DRAFT_1705239 [Mycena metata]|uniref:Uncharacterized protein n=1 Tax=Mycena metata TaxID=1033252 RepID=A0AAD7DY83_9AGAR|nr:hypothetical protein B0H16DRAFT_1705239 [Mycena metata]